MTFALTPELSAAIQAHARADYPKEACGLILDGVYAPRKNIAQDPTQDFEIADAVMLKAHASGKLQAIVHSHPNGPDHPSAADMASQIASGVPWVIVSVGEADAAAPFVFGDGGVIPPVIGREFRHGVTDCYSIIRDVFRLGRERLAEQDVDWPLAPIDVPEFPRDDAWWTRGQDLYAEGFAKAGFREIPREAARPGDVFLTSIRSPVLNHGGVVVGGGLILHHLPLRLSRREPAGIWQNAAAIWLRHNSVSDDDDA